MKGHSTTVEGRTWLELLQPNSCWSLLKTAEIGRVAVIVNGRPEIYPVNFVVDNDTVVFRTDPGSKLDGLVQHPETSFEVDGVGPDTWSGWSVLVKGRASFMETGDEAAQAATLPLQLWAPGRKDHWIRLVPSEITGRRIIRPTTWRPR